MSTGEPMQRSPAEVKQFLAALFDRAAATYETVGVPFFGPLGHRLVQVAQLRPGWRVLDAGCGRGSVLVPAAEAVGPDGEVVGIDLAPGMVAATAALAEGRGLRNVRVLEMDAEDPSPELGDFDAVVAGFVVFMLPDPAEVRGNASPRRAARVHLMGWLGPPLEAGR